MKSKNNFKYQSKMNDLTTNALIFVYLEKSTSARKETIQSTNQRLVKWLKPKIKSATWKQIKSEVKLMVKIGQAKDGDLEMKLTELHGMAQDYLSNNAERVFDLFNYLEEEFGLDSKMYDPKKELISDCVYALDDNLTDYIDEGSFTTNMYLYIKPENSTMLVDAINDTGIFHSVLIGLDEDKQLDKVLLHPAA